MEGLNTDKTMFYRDLGSMVFQFDEDKITPNNMRKIAERTKAIKKGQLLAVTFAKCPMNPGETAGEYDTRRRASEALERKDSQTRRENESDQEYLDRLMDDEEMLPDLDLIYSLFKMLAETLGACRSLSQEEFGDLPTDKVVLLVKEVLTRVRINVDAVFPGFPWEKFATPEPQQVSPAGEGVYI